MKKIIVATAIALAATSASAVEVGGYLGRDFADRNENFWGVTVGEKFGAVTVTAGFDRTASSVNDQNRATLTGAINLFNLGPVTVAGKAGIGWLYNSNVEDGFIGRVGVGASMPIAQKLDFTVDYFYQYGQDRVSAFNGSTLTAGLKYRF